MRLTKVTKSLKQQRLHQYSTYQKRFDLSKRSRNVKLIIICLIHHSCTQKISIRNNNRQIVWGWGSFTWGGGQRASPHPHFETKQRGSSPARISDKFPAVPKVRSAGNHAGRRFSSCCWKCMIYSGVRNWGRYHNYPNKIVTDDGLLRWPIDFKTIQLFGQPAVLLNTADQLDVGYL